MSLSNKRVTLKNIADECGYSVNTVSRALRNDTKLPAETLNKIQSTASKLGYVRNILASSLRSGKSHIIAVIVDNIQNPYYSTIISHLDIKLKEAGYSLMILSNQVSQELSLDHVSAELGQEMVDVAIAHAVDGILLFPYVNHSNIAAHIMRNHIPFVQIGREIPGLEADLVRCDDYAGGYLAGSEFVKRGHSRFLYISGEDEISSQIDRQRGFIDAITGSGIPIENIRIITSADMLRSIFQKNIMELLTPIDFTAVFSFNDYMAYPVINCLHLANYRIPEDISVIGFDYIHQDVPYALPLTSIANPPEYSFVNTIAELLLSRIEDPSLAPRTEIFPVMLYDEGTLGACKN